MHPSALNFGKLFFETYCSGLQGAVVHDIGAQNVNGSLRDVLPAHLGYVGVDFVEGNGVDIVLQDPYRLPFADDSLDVLVCSSCLEHSQFFWVVFLEMLRVLKPHGLLYLNVPSNGSIHRYPVDCWRFYPDAGRALEAWAERNGHAPALTESFIGERSPDTYESGGGWNDFVAVFVKDRRHAADYAARMIDALPGHTNGYDSRTGSDSRPQFLSPDHAELVARGRAVAEAQGRSESLLVALQELTRSVESTRAQVSERDERIAALVRELAAHAHDLEEARKARAELRVVQDRLDTVLRSHSWRMTAPVRRLAAWLGGSRSWDEQTRTDIATIRASGRFDEAFYRSRNPDVPLHVDAIAHYCERGWRELRDPAPGFSTRHYLDTYADIRDAGLNPFVHYILAGAAEQREAVPTAGRATQRAGSDTGATA